MSIRLLVLLLLSTLLSACDALFGYASGDAQEGVVVDAETGEPVSDAFVIGQWSGRGYESSICFHLSMTKTDALGRYYIPAWREKNEFGSASHQKVLVYAYKHGYYYSLLEQDRNRIQLRKVYLAREDIEERIGILREVARQISCYSAGKSKNNVAEFYQTLYSEALDYAKGEEFEDLLYLRNKVEQYELGDEVASERYQRSSRALKMETEKEITETRVIENTDRFARGANTTDEDEN